MGVAHIDPVVPGESGELVRGRHAVEASLRVSLEEGCVRDPIPGLYSDRAFLPGKGCKFGQPNVTSRGKLHYIGVAEGEEVASILGEKGVVGSFGEAGVGVGVFEGTVAVGPEAACAPGKNRAGGVPGDVVGIDTEGVPETREGETIRGVHEPGRELVELGGVHEEFGIVVREVGEVGVGGGSAEFLEVVFGLVPEFAHIGFVLLSGWEFRLPGGGGCWCSCGVCGERCGVCGSRGGW